MNEGEVQQYYVEGSHEAIIRKYSALTARHGAVATKLERLRSEKASRKRRARELQAFIRTLEAAPDIMSTWDNAPWRVLLI